MPRVKRQRLSIPAKLAADALANDGVFGDKYLTLHPTKGYRLRSFNAQRATHPLAQLFQQLGLAAMARGAR